MKSLLYQVAASEPLMRLTRRRATSRGIAVFMYHDIGEARDGDDAWQIVRKDRFREQLRYLQRHYDVISLDDALDVIQRHRRPRRPTAVLTFDDGLIGNYHHLLPIVQESRAPVIIYIATEQVQLQSLYWFDRIANLLQGSHSLELDLGAWNLGHFIVNAPAGAMRWAQIQQVLMAVKGLDPHCCDDAAQAVQAQVLAQTGKACCTAPLAPMTVEMIRELSSEPLVTLGGHTHGHEVLPLLRPDEARDSIRRGKALLEDWIGRPVRHFAFPAGQTSLATRALVVEAGFVTAMGTQVGMWNGDCDPLEIPRISIGRYDGMAKFRVHSVGGLGALLRQRPVTAGRINPTPEQVTDTNTVIT